MPELQTHSRVVSARNTMNASALVADAHALGIENLAEIEKHDLYFVRGAFDENDLLRLAKELLTDAVTWCI